MYTKEILPPPPLMEHGQDEAENQVYRGPLPMSGPYPSALLWSRQRQAPYVFSPWPLGNGSLVGTSVIMAGLAMMSKTEVPPNLHKVWTSNLSLL